MVFLRIEVVYRLEKLVLLRTTDQVDKGSKFNYKLLYRCICFWYSQVQFDRLNSLSHFQNFLVGELRADQMTFVNTIISYLSKNGTIDKSMFYESPFTDQNDQGIDGIFDLEKKQKVVSIIDQINYNAIA